MKRRAVTTRVRAAVGAIDERLARAAAPLERGQLLQLLVHTAFASAAEAERGMVHPQERLTRAGLVRAVEHLREAGYRFVGADEIDAGLPTWDRCAHLTMDDGYASNAPLVTEVLRPLGVPVTIFVSSGHVAEGKAFWWDVVYRRRAAQGRAAEAAREITAIHALPPQAIERHLLREFGPAALRPAGDLDRPLTPGELRELARMPGVAVGNHTRDHATLAALPPEGAERQIRDAQRELEEMTGRRPTWLSYPHGSHSPAVAAAARRCGIRVAVTVEGRPERLPLRPGRLMTLGRVVPDGAGDLEAGLRRARAAVQVERGARRLARRPAAA